MAKTLPPMLEVMKEIGGVEFPDVFAKLASAEEAAKNAPVVDAEGAVEQEEAGTIEPENKEA
jgi:hypothetical protein